MLTLGFHNPFAVLGKESPKPETRASAQGASYPGVLRRALSPKSPPRSRRGSADLASPRSPPKVTQASQGESDADGTPRQPNEDVAPMVEAGTPLKAFLNALVNAEAAVAAADGAPRRPQPRSPPKVEDAGGRRSALKSPENPRPRKRARVTFASQELSALPFTPPPDEAATDDGDPIADLLDHLSAALDSADAVRAAICDGDEATQRSVARVAAALDSEQTSSGAESPARMQSSASRSVQV